MSHGGHSAAAGLKIDEANVELFRAQFCEYAAGELSGTPGTAELRIDAEVPFSALSERVVRDLDRLAPFGHDNPRPLLCTSNVTLSEPPKRIGSGERHLALRLEQHGIQLRGVAFGGGDWATPLSQAGGPIAVAFRPQINHFRGRKTVELQVCDWHLAAVPASGELCA